MNADNSTLVEPIGRVDEFTRLRRLLHLECGSASGGATVLLTGEAGVGKTHLAAAVADSARGRSVIRIVGIESEGAVTHAALATLGLRLAAIGVPVLDTIIRSQAPTSALAMSMVVLDALTAAAAEAPILLIVDDAHWIDAASAEALAFALRRIDHDACSALVVARSGHVTPLAAAGFTEMAVTPLSPDALKQLVRRDLSPHVLERCVESSHGNTLAFITMIGNLTDEQARGFHGFDLSATVGPELVNSLVSRIERLPDQTRRALSVVAASESVADPVSAAMQVLGVDSEALGPAHAAGVLTYDLSGAPMLSHPLYRTAIVALVGRAGMRAAHAALADAQPEFLDSAWHRAAAVDGTDEDVAKLLEHLAERDFARGAAANAAAAYERAAQLSVDRANRFHRTLMAGQMRWEAVDPQRAIPLLDRAGALAATPIERADLAGVNGDVRAWYVSTFLGTEMQLRAAAEVAATDPGRAAILELRASLLFALAAETERAFESAQRAVELSVRSGGIEQIGAYAVRAMVAQLSGRRALADLDLSIVRPLTDISADDHTIEVQLFLQAVGMTLMDREEHDDADRILMTVIASARRLGLYGVLGFTAGQVSEIALRRGRLIDAVFLAHPDVELHRRTDLPSASPGQAALTRASAALGRFDEAFEYGEAATSNARSTRMYGLEAWAEAGIALAHLGLGDIDRALDSFGRVGRTASRYIEPSFLWWEGDYADALLQAGQRQRAELLADGLEGRSNQCGTRYGHAVAARIRGVLRADPALLGVSIESFRALDARLETAKSLLALSETCRDGDAAGQAAVLFEQCGALHLAERAWKGTDRQAVRTAAVDTSELTPAELRVAACVAQGKSNREIADDLFVSLRTVEAHLTATFRKLGLKRRTELVLVLGPNGR